jgi:zinc protease
VLQANADKLQGWVVIGHEVPVVPAEDEAALHVMDYILGAYHLDSRLFRASRETRGLTNDNSGFLEPGINGPGSYSFRTYGRPEAVRLLVDVTFREIETIRETLPTADEIFVAKGALVDGLWATRYTTGLDATRNYAIEWLRHGSHHTSASYPERISTVTPQQVREAARRYLDPDRMIVSVVGPLEQIGAAPMIESEPQLNVWGTVERVDGGR